MAVMKFRHAVAFPLVGWYLTRPPIPHLDPQALHPDRASPLARWKIVESFSTQTECEVHLRDSRWNLCVASDDPRLSRKSTSPSAIRMTCWRIPKTRACENFSPADRREATP
jgi:hypothetical protein